MKQVLINQKILFVITVTSILTMITVMLFSTTSLKRIIDRKQERVYTEKIDTILDMLRRKHALLEKTFLAEAYEDGFKNSFLADFKEMYYKDNDSETYPYLYSCEGYVIAHPNFDHGYIPPPDDAFLRKMADMKEGSLNYVYRGRRKWMIFRYFKDWDWIVGYVVSHDIKYASYRHFRNILFVIMISAIFLSGLMLMVVITRITKPISVLTKASSALANGNIDYPVEIRTNDELGDLSKTFIYMRKAIQEKMLALQSQNKELEHEIFERKRITEALAESEERYRLLINNTNDLIVKFDKEKRLLFVSPSYCKFFGKNEDELIGKSFLPFIHDATREQVEQSIEKVFYPPYMCFHEEQALTSDGLQWIAWSNKGIPDESGNVKEVIGAGRIVTERKKAEEERERLISDLAKKNEEMEAFTYSVSHDLKSPLITVMGFINFIKEYIEKKKYDDIPAYVDRIHNAAKKMHQLLDGLLNLSRIGRVVNPPETFSFKEIAYDAKELLTARIEENKVQLIIEDGLPDVHGDKQRILEVVVNLVENAIKFSAGKDVPEIVIGHQSQDDVCVLYIKDNGIGLETEYTQRVFELFKKLDPHSTGTGVGLALVKRIIEYHQGKIWVESDGIDQGCTFYFTLPVASSYVY